MEFKVREVTGKEKSQQEIEQALLDKHEQEVNATEVQEVKPEAVVFCIICNMLPGPHRGGVRGDFLRCFE